MRIRVTEKFRWSPPELNRTWSQTYKPGEYTVTSACGAAAIAAGKAVKIAPPRKKEVGEE